MNQNPIGFYENQLINYREALKKVKTKLFWVGMLRLALFLAAGFGAYFMRSSINYAVLIGVSGIVLFLIMVSKNEDIRLEKKRLERLIEINLMELQVLARNLDGIDGGDELIGEDHYYNQDIDLFGKGSIFQMINRTETLNGKAALGKILNSNSSSDVLLKQKMIQELALKPEWRQNFQTTASLVKVDVKNEIIEGWLSNYTSTIPKLFSILPLIVSCLSVLGFVAYGFGFISSIWLIIWLFVGLFITMPFFGRVSKIYGAGSQMKATFSQYSKLILEIENQNFESELLKVEQQKIVTNGKNASEILKKLSSELNSLDQRNNIFFAFIANGYLLWDLRYAYRIESWIKEYGKSTTAWFEAIANFDAYNSLSNYAFNYPEHIYPQITEDSSCLIKAEQLGHQLLKPEQLVANNFSINTTDFVIITGANMAGKSTFLRTVALNLVLANTGLPVCAKSFEYKPVKLVTSMRTSDSLQNDESYFFSELKRLKFIVEELKKENYFIILDEILKGTNSKDKEEGSKKFVQKLVATGSAGIIATHDLSLCELSETLPQIKNHYFDAEIISDELHFDYRYKDGVCQNMNASFLLRKMEIV